MSHRETDRFFGDSGVHLPSSNNQFHYRRVTFSSPLKSKVGNILVKSATLRVILNLDGQALDALLNLDGQALDALQKFKCVGIRRELDRVCL
jgi:hypothetical protein